MQALASRVCEESFRLHRKAGKIPGSGKLVKPRHVVGMQSKRALLTGPRLKAVILREESCTASLCSTLCQNDLKNAVFKLMQCMAAAL